MIVGVVVPLHAVGMSRRRQKSSPGSRGAPLADTHRVELLSLALVHSGGGRDYFGTQPPEVDFVAAGAALSRGF